MNTADGLFCDLRHGVQLAVWNTSGRLSIGGVVEFLAKAMEHFKHERGQLKTGLYTGGPYRGTATERRKVLGTMQRSCPNKEGLTAALWIDAVIDAYSRATTVEQMLGELPAWQRAAKEEGGYVREVIGMLDKPGGDLLALGAMVRRGLVISR